MAFSQYQLQHVSLFENYAIPRTSAVCTAAAKWKSLLKGPAIIEDVDIQKSGENREEDNNKKDQSVTEDNVTGSQNAKLVIEEARVQTTESPVISEDGKVTDNATDGMASQEQTCNAGKNNTRKKEVEEKKKPVNGKNSTRLGKGGQRNAKLKKRGTAGSLSGDVKGITTGKKERVTSVNTVIKSKGITPTNGPPGRTKFIRKVNRNAPAQGNRGKIVGVQGRDNQTSTIPRAPHKTGGRLMLDSSSKTDAKSCQVKKGISRSKNENQENCVRESAEIQQSCDLLVEKQNEGVHEQPNQVNSTVDELKIPTATISRPDSAPVYGQIVARRELVKLEKIEEEFKDHRLIAAIPILPVFLAVICFIFNIFAPGTGTIIASFSLFCCNKRPEPALGKKEDAVDLMITNFCVGVSQFFTVTFLFIGLIWSITWGVFMVQFAWVRYKKDKKDKEERERHVTIGVANAFLRPGFWRV